MRICNSKIVGLAFGVGLAIAASTIAASAATVSLTDGTFGNITFEPGASGFHPPQATFSGSVDPSNGNPGAALRADITWSGSSSSAAGAGVIDNALTYTPSSQGAITSLIASDDKNLAAGNFPANTPTRFLLSQGGHFWQFITGAQSTPVGSWIHFTTPVLNAASFQQVCLVACGPGAFDNPSNLGTDTAATLNFVNGSAITFGIVSNGGYLGNGTNTAYFDNLDFELTTTPLPSTWLMLLSGFVGLGFFAYRGTKRRTALAAA
jgi:hypothetical protein